MMRAMALSVLVAAGAGAAWARKAAPAKAAEKAKKESKAETRFSGKVEWVDASAGKLTVGDGRGKTMTFTLGARAEVVKAGKTVDLAEVKAGDAVSVTYEGGAESAKVKKVEVRSVKAKKTKKKLGKSSGKR